MRQTACTSIASSCSNVNVSTSNLCFGARFFPWGRLYILKYITSLMMLLWLSSPCNLVHCSLLSTSTHSNLLLIRCSAILSCFMYERAEATALNRQELVSPCGYRIGMEWHRYFSATDISFELLPIGTLNHLRFFCVYFQALFLLESFTLRLPCFLTTYKYCLLKCDSNHALDNGFLV